MTDKVRVRFAPSPTGPLHMGGVRTALFNYLFAKKHNGKFILRIEDTDQTRYVKGTEKHIKECLKWTGINIDEGIGSFPQRRRYGPYKQSNRKKTYEKYVNQLLESENAYYAFDTPEELDKLRAQAESEGKTFAYDQHNRNNLNNSIALPKEETEKNLNNNVPYVIRFKIPENQELPMEDIIRGKMIINTSTLDDKVIFKSDGLPTYHLANVVDDHEMKISHVIRGEEWLPSMPLHILLYLALNFDQPKFAHLPLILKPTGKGKLSKRDGDKLGFPVFPLEWKSPEGEISSGYREEGYFPDAFINMLAFLGWNPGTEQEIFSMDELVEAFSLERVGKSGARFDPEKAKWYNQQYLKEKSDNELALLFEPILKQENFTAELPLIEKIVGLVKERAVFVSDLWEQSWFFFKAPETYDAKTVKKRWKENTPDLLKKVADILESVKSFTSAETENAVKSWIESSELGFGPIMNPLRLALVGGGFGPHLFDIIEVIGKEETLKRINLAIERINK